MKVLFGKFSFKSSIDPIPNIFQYIINKFNIDIVLINYFIYSMLISLSSNIYDELSCQNYVLQYAEVVGFNVPESIKSGRTHLPDVDMKKFNGVEKKMIEEDNIYHYALFNKIKKTPSDRIFNKSI